MVKNKISLKNADLKGGFLGFNRQKSFINNYISEEKGLISSYFSTKSIDVLEKIKIAKEINKKIIELLTLYYKSNSITDSSNINIYINNISTENLRVFTQKTLDTNDFINSDFLNINLQNVFNFFDSNIGTEKCKEHFIDIYYQIVTTYVGNENKFFKIHKKYNNLLKYKKDFFEQVINFIKDRNSIYLFNINFIIIIIYTYTDTNLVKSDNIYFPKNYYEIIIKSFFEYVKKYGYPSMNTDFYSILRTLNKNEVDDLNKFDPYIKLSDIITHPSYIAKDISIINKTPKPTPIQKTVDFSQTNFNTEDSPSPSRPSKPQRSSLTRPSKSASSPHLLSKRASSSSSRPNKSASPPLLSKRASSSSSRPNKSASPPLLSKSASPHRRLSESASPHRLSESAHSSTLSLSTYLKKKPRGSKSPSSSQSSSPSRPSKPASSSFSPSKSASPHRRLSESAAPHRLSESAHSSTLSLSTYLKKKPSGSKSPSSSQSSSPSRRSKSASSSSSPSKSASPTTLAWSRYLEQQPRSSKSPSSSEPRQHTIGTSETTLLSKPASSFPLSKSAPPSHRLSESAPPHRLSESAHSSILSLPMYLEQQPRGSKSPSSSEPRQHTISTSETTDIIDIVTEQINTSANSNLFGSNYESKNSPSNYKDFLALLKLIDDNTEYGYRWKKLNCADLNKYGCNNLNYDLNDLKHNNYVIEKSEKNKNIKLYAFYDSYIQEINTFQDDYPFPEEQIRDTRETFKVINQVMTELKKNKKFEDIIIIDFESVFIAYNRLKKYDLRVENSSIHIELSQQNNLLLEPLSTASDSAYGSIFKASLNVKKRHNYNFAVKLSFCDNVTEPSYIILNQSNLKEIHLFDIVTRYAIAKININLPIIYKTIQLNVLKKDIPLLFGDKVSLDNDAYAGCKLGDNPPINCSIIELYSGDCNKYVSNFYQKNNGDYFDYLLSGFENIIISILSFWSVTKCVHNDAHMGNFLYKLTNHKTPFNKYNIQGQSFYISNYTKCRWTLWDYGSCMPFVYDNYFTTGIDDIYHQDDIRRSVYLYLLFNILNKDKCKEYTKKLYEIFKNSHLELNNYQYMIMQYIVIYIVNELLNNTSSNYYDINSVNLFFDKILYFIYNLHTIKIDDLIKQRFYIVIQNISTYNSFNINEHLEFIFTAFKNPSDKTIKKFVSNNIYNKFEKNNLKKYFGDELSICLICCKFITIYSKKKKNYKAAIKDKSSNHNFTNNVISMVKDTILSFKQERLLKDLNINHIFSINIDESTNNISNDEYFIGNNNIGYYWIKVNNIDNKMLKPLKKNNYAYKQFIQYFSDNYNETSDIVVIKEIKNKELKSIFDFLNTFSSRRFIFRKDPSYYYNYYIKFDNKYFVTYNDIDYQLYLYNKRS